MNSWMNKVGRALSSPFHSQIHSFALFDALGRNFDVNPIIGLTDTNSSTHVVVEQEIEE